MYCGSLIRAADITDGVSNTCLLGEKYVCPDHYDTGGDPSDNESCVIGENADISRWSGRSPNFIPPWQDAPGYAAYPDWSGFGSAHANSFNMAFCDGSVHSLSYTIDLALFSYLCNRKDDQPIDAQKLNL
jgi:prepilin-type processing-associated H-X9-DG protein